MTIDDSLMLDIKGTFEVAIARNRLRQLAAQHNCPLMLQARAAAAMTSIAELVLFQANQENRQLQLNVAIREDTERQGIEFSFYAPLHQEIMAHFSAAEWQLEHACDEFEVNSHGTTDYIVMRLWTRRKC